MKIFLTMLVITILVILWAVFFRGEIYAQCPDTGCNFLDKGTYYADYPIDSWEYINAYCNQMINNPNYKCK